MKNITGLISVIIPVFNRANVIEECINSVLGQTYQNFEIVIVDDGSTDNTYKICKSLAEKDTKIKLFKGEHAGVSAARNTAIEKANGELVFFLDSDDVIHPLLFETLITAMESNNAAIGATNVIDVSQTIWNQVRQRIKNGKSATGTTTYLSPEKVIDAALGGDSPLGCIGGVMMRRDLVDNTKFNTEIYIGEDFYFIYENIIKGASAVFLKQKWYYVRHHENNSSWDYSFNGFFTRFNRRKLVWESEEKLGRTQYANKQKASAFYCFSVCFEKNKPYSKDSKKMRKVLREYKTVILPVLSFKGKIAYLLGTYCPITYSLILKLRKNRK